MERAAIGDERERSHAWSSVRSIALKIQFSRPPVGARLGIGLGSGFGFFFFFVRGQGFDAGQDHLHKVGQDHEAIGRRVACRWRCTAIRRRLESPLFSAYGLAGRSSGREDKTTAANDLLVRPPLKFAVNGHRRVRFWRGIPYCRACSHLERSCWLLHPSYCRLWPRSANPRAIGASLNFLVALD